MGQRSQRDSSHTELRQQQHQGEMEPDLRGCQGLLMGARTQGLSKQSGRPCGFQLRPSS